MKKKHHLIDMPILLIPGIFLLASVFLLIFDKSNWAFLSLGIAIVIAILIHKEDNF